MVSNKTQTTQRANFSDYLIYIANIIRQDTVWIHKQPKW